jgi:hypothetical protein
MANSIADRFLPDAKESIGDAQWNLMDRAFDMSMNFDRFAFYVSENQRVFARYPWWSGTGTPSDPFKVNFGGLYSYTGAQNFVVGDTYTFNPHTVADFRLSYLRARNGFTPQQVGTDLSLFGPAWGALSSQVTLPVAPLASISGIAGFSGVDNRSIANDFALSGNLAKFWEDTRSSSVAKFGAIIGTSRRAMSLLPVATFSNPFPPVPSQPFGYAQQWNARFSAS